MNLFLGADGGQTHSQAVLTDETGHLLGTGHAGPCNHYDEPGGKERFQAALFEITMGALREAGLSMEVELTAACYGLTSNWFRAEGTTRQFLKTLHFRAEEDTITAHVGALSGEPGIVLIAGTGTVAYGCDKTGRTARSGGLGYLLSDEGAGFDIGLHALRAAVRACDGRGPQTSLVGLFLNHFHFPNFEDVAQAIYANKQFRLAIANLTPIVAQAAGDSDVVAIRLLQEAAVEQAKCVLSVAAQLTWPDPLVATTGGVFKAGQTIMNPFVNYLKQNLPSATIIPGHYPPVLGAVLMALQDGGTSITPEILQNLDQIYDSPAKMQSIITED